MIRRGCNGKVWGEIHIRINTVMDLIRKVLKIDLGYRGEVGSVAGHYVKIL